MIGMYLENVFQQERRRKLGIHKRCGETGRRGDLHGVEGVKRL